jgi:predicted acyltransferase
MSHDAAVPPPHDASVVPSDESAWKPPSPAPGRRLDSIDAYRGLVMFLMMAEVLEFCQVAEKVPGSRIWAFLCHHQSHVEWTGCVLHDLIQPSFSFLVGVALPFSIASRLARGQSTGLMTAHAAWRSIILIFLGVFLRSIGRDRTNFTFEDTLSQIGLGYTFLFLLGRCRPRTQWIAFVAIIIGYWGLFAAYTPGSGYVPEAAGVPPDWAQAHNLTGFAAHWNKNANPAWAFDTWFLNLFSRARRFEFNGGGYATLSFIPTLATMILGLIAGGVLRRDWAPWSKVLWMTIAGVLSLTLGWGLGELGICPVVKRIWTPSWVLFSGGICLLFLAAFYAMMDVLNWKIWAFPLRVIGANSIAAYCLSHLIEPFIAGSFKTHLGRHAFDILGPEYAPFVQGCAVLTVLWLILYWMYEREIYVRI